VRPPIATAVSFVDCINRGDVDGLAALMTLDHTFTVFAETRSSDGPAMSKRGAGPSTG